MKRYYLLKFPEDGTHGIFPKSRITNISLNQDTCVCTIERVEYAANILHSSGKLLKVMEIYLNFSLS